MSDQKAAHLKDRPNPKSHNDGQDPAGTAGKSASLMAPKKAERGGQSRSTVPKRVFRTDQWVTLAVGVTFTILGILVLMISFIDFTPGQVVAALALAAVGVDAIYSANRSRPSLLFRIGPMP